MSDALVAERDSLRAEVDRLTTCLAKANANHEDFERRWYLACDENERLLKERDEARKTTAIAILSDAATRDHLRDLCASVERDRDEVRVLLAKEQEEHALSTQFVLTAREQRDRFAARCTELERERDELRRFLDAEKAQVDGMGKRNAEAMRILGVILNNREGVVEGAQRVVDERDAALAAADQMRPVYEAAHRWAVFGRDDSDDEYGLLSAVRTSKTKKDADV